jgi:hypothetical protein
VPIGERGAFCDVRTPDNGVINGVSVTDYTGTLAGLPSERRTHAWSQGHTIMISGAQLRLDGLDFGEHNIKNFHLTEDPLLFTDGGLEVITRDRFPSSTWKQESHYYRPDGGIGRLHFTKKGLYFTQGPRQFVCNIILDLDVDNAGDEWSFNGLVGVRRLDVTGVPVSPIFAPGPRPPPPPPPCLRPNNPNPHCPR